jgi:lysophospholipase L1-like esterase
MKVHSSVFMVWALAVMSSIEGRASGDLPPDIFPVGSVILFQGDSITHGGRKNDMNHFMGHGYQAEVAMRYLAAYPQRGLKFLNRGVSGDTTEKMLARWERDALAPVGDEIGFGRQFGYTNKVVSSSIPLRPDFLSILIGVNDHDKGMSTEMYSSNLVQLVDRALAVNPKLKIVLGEPFRHPRSRSPEYAAKQAFVRRLAQERGFAFVPYQKLFDEKLSKLNPDPAYWSWDGGHPTYAAHFYMANLWIESVVTFYGSGK